MLKLLLDEHISPSVAKGLRRRDAGLKVHSMTEWHGGAFLGADDAAFLRVAATEGLTLVTYDRRTIPMLLKAWAEEGAHHGGVIFVDEKTLSPGDIGGLIAALWKVVRQRPARDWTDRIAFLQA